MNPDVNKIFDKFKKDKVKLSTEKVELSEVRNLGQAIVGMNNFAKRADKLNQSITTNYNEASALDRKADKVYQEANELKKQLVDLQKDIDERFDTASDLGEKSDKYLSNTNKLIQTAKKVVQDIQDEIDDANSFMRIIESKSKELGVSPSNIEVYSKANNRIPVVEKIKRNLQLAIKEALKPLK